MPSQLLISLSLIPSMCLIPCCMLFAESKSYLLLPFHREPFDADVPVTFMASKEKRLMLHNGCSHMKVEKLLDASISGRWIVQAISQVRVVFLLAFVVTSSSLCFGQSCVFDVISDERRMSKQVVFFSSVFFPASHPASPVL
ncbi:hypothetical protein BJ508DRAFT_312102 [Ascobolus immersus RN42]|uniref:Uncharacterized protein n=1 Tax=Ascobolus immersus RN42 TaxID=1160509 RepID=A0A3N4HTZ4_ASCIM|nr:hypothetical protein BJ508DRAFT_312102 [Ascobolus immersus RN42]